MGFGDQSEQVAVPVERPRTDYLHNFQGRLIVAVEKTFDELVITVAVDNSDGLLPDPLDRLDGGYARGSETPDPRPRVEILKLNHWCSSAPGGPLVARLSISPSPSSRSME